MERKKLVIVGAGVSGLYLAYLLEDKFEVTILEARGWVALTHYKQTPKKFKNESNHTE